MSLPFHIGCAFFHAFHDACICAINGVLDAGGIFFISMFVFVLFLYTYFYGNVWGISTCTCAVHFMMVRRIYTNNGRVLSAVSQWSIVIWWNGACWTPCTGYRLFVLSMGSCPQSACWTITTCVIHTTLLRTW